MFASHCFGQNFSFSLHFVVPSASPIPRFCVCHRLAISPSLPTCELLSYYSKCCAVLSKQIGAGEPPQLSSIRRIRFAGFARCVFCCSGCVCAGLCFCRSTNGCALGNVNWGKGAREYLLNLSRPVNGKPIPLMCNRKGSSWSETFTQSSLVFKSWRSLLFSKIFLLPTRRWRETFFVLFTFLGIFR